MRLTSRNRGYIFEYCPNHPFANKIGYIYQHRLIIEAYLERVLLPTEIVHHINGIRDDNKIENLMLFSSNTKHLRLHNLGKHYSPRTEFKKGMKLNKELIEKRSALLRGRKRPEHSIFMKTHPNKGWFKKDEHRPMSEEHKRRMKENSFWKRRNLFEDSIKERNKKISQTLKRKHL